MKIEQATASSVKKLWEKVESGGQRANCLEDAAQTLASELHTRFEV